MCESEMWYLVNVVALELIRQGKPQRQALFLLTDPRKRAELEAVLESARRRYETAGAPTEV